MSLPCQRDFSALAYVLGGKGTVGEKGRPIESGQLAVFGDGDTITIKADARQDGFSARRQ